MKEAKQVSSSRESKDCETGLAIIELYNQRCSYRTLQLHTFPGSYACGIQMGGGYEKL